MGIYDRDYFRNDQNNRNRQRRKSVFGSFSVVTWIILINVALFLLNGLIKPQNLLAVLSSLDTNTWSFPLFWYKFLTYGFTHDPTNINHILFNMLGLFFLGRAVEMRLGKREFLIFYLVSIVVCGICWEIIHFSGPKTLLMGASGAISAVVILFALYYPRVTVLIMGIIPMPAWMMGVMFVLFDMFGTQSTGNVAHDVHIMGAAFALLYFLNKWRFEALLTRRSRSSKSVKPRNTKLRVWPHNEESSTPKPISVLEREVDLLLDKIGKYGESSLTDAERQTLRQASEEYQKRSKKE